MKAMGIIFSNIYDNTLGELTVNRTVASLPFGGRYRQIDFVLSNMSNSGIYTVGVITKYNYRSLMDHLISAGDWDLRRKGEGLTILPPFANGNTGVYKGKLEALYYSKDYIASSKADYIVLSDSNVICNIDLRLPLEQHIKSKAEVTVIATRGSVDDKRRYGLVLEADKKGRATEVLLDAKADGDQYVGTGMFIMKKSLLLDEIEELHSKGYFHFEKEYLQRKFNKEKIKINVYEFKGLLMRNEGILSYYKNNLSLLSESVRNRLLKGANIYTKIKDEIPTLYGDGAVIENCLVADGCKLLGNVSDSIIFRNVRIERGANVSESIIMQGSEIGKNVRLKCVILDKNVKVTEGAELIGSPEHPMIVKKGEVV